MQKITPFLWFDTQVEEAVTFYTQIFPNSKIGEVSRYGKAGPGPEGTIMSATFYIEGQEFMGLNGGPLFKFTPAISFFIHCETQEEIDHLWDKLSAGGEPGQCGWVTDKFGVSWQIVPTMLGEVLGNSDPEKAQKAMQAMLKMKKLDIKTLREAVE